MQKNVLIAAFIVGFAPLTSACVSFQAIEPVVSPPTSFTGDRTVAVEFLQPAFVGMRCAQRGAKFLGLPGINSGACADLNLITMIDPCRTLTAGSFAHALCAALSAPTGADVESADDFPAQRRGPVYKAALTSGNSFSRSPAASRQRLQFVQPSTLTARCTDRGLDVVSVDGAAFCAADGMVTLPNPCALPKPGWYERTFCHELGHSNGWPADHSLSPGRTPLLLASQSPEATAFAAQILGEAGSR